jgi:hypothetical protein
MRNLIVLFVVLVGLSSCSKKETNINCYYTNIVHLEKSPMFNKNNFRDLPNWKNIYKNAMEKTIAEPYTMYSSTTSEGDTIMLSCYKR